MNFPHLNYSNEFSHNFQICFIFFVSCDFHSSISIIYVHLLSKLTITFSHFDKVLQRFVGILEDLYKTLITTRITLY